jgi:hypothetical protein
MHLVRLFSAGLLWLPQFSSAASVSDPSTAWTSLGINYDFLADQQTGDPASDIVGSGTNYGFFTTFNNNGSASQTDGTLGFRLRLDDHGGNNNNISFSRNAWVGLDADIDGDIDVFLGLNLQGNASTLGIFAPGTGSNTSPNTTSISSTTATSYTISSSNYNYRPVNYLTDGGTTNDVSTSNSGDTDYYVSFMVAFADVVAFLNTRSISINDQSAIRYVVATSTQSNSLNQDLGGVNGSINSTSTWEQLGGFTPTVTSYGNTVPEPGTALLGGLALGAGCLRRRRR